MVSATHFKSLLLLATCWVVAAGTALVAAADGPSFVDSRSAGRNSIDCSEPLARVAPVTLAAAGPSYTYQITVKTFDYAAPHKASSVMFQLAGTAGSLPQHTEAGADSWAQAGQVHTFNVTAANVGVVRYIKVTPQAAAGTTSPGSWLLSYINVTKYDSSSSQAGPTSLFSYDYPLAVGDCITLVELTVLYEMKRDVMAQARKNLTSSFTAAGPFVRCSGTSSCTWTGSILIVAASSAAKPIPPRIKFVRPGTTAQVLSPDSLSKAKLLYSYTAGTGGQQRSIGFWRFTLRAKLDGRAAKRIKYSVLLPPGSGASRGGMLQLPSCKGDWRIMQISCNSYNPADETYFAHFPNGDAPTWSALLKQHAAQPFNLMQLAGDQLYNDHLRFQIPSFHPQPTTCWEALHSPNERQAFWANLPATDESRQELEDSMLNHYLNVFGAGAMAPALANIPAVMMWDDHETIDGFGSYSPILQNSPIFKQWGAAGRKFFMLFQQHASPGSSAAQLKAEGFPVAGSAPGQPLSQVLQLSPRVLWVVPDWRSERTQTQMMSAAHTAALQAEVVAKLKKAKGAIQHLAFVAPSPLAYPSYRIDLSFPTLVNLGGLGPFEDTDLADDLADQWVNQKHLPERNALITWLQQVAANHTVRVSSFGGDSHYASLAVLNSTTATPTECDPNYIISAVSSPMGVAPAGASLKASWDLVGYLETPNAATAIAYQPIFPPNPFTKPGSQDIFFFGRHYLVIEDKAGTGNAASSLAIQWRCEQGTQGLLPVPDQPAVIPALKRTCA